MNHELHSLEQKRKTLEDKLAKLPKKKWEVWKLIILSIVMTFVGPYISMNKGSSGNKMSYHDSVMIFVIIFIIVVPVACYMHFQKINSEILDTESELENVTREINKVN